MKQAGTRNIFFYLALQYSIKILKSILNFKATSVVAVIWVTYS